MEADVFSEYGHSLKSLMNSGYFGVNFKKYPLVHRSILVFFLFFMGIINLNAQDYIKTVDGQGFFAKIVSDEENKIIYESNKTKFTILKKEIVLIEYSERGLIIYNKEFIQEIDIPRDSNALLYAKGNCVYIPFSSNRVVQRAGSKQLRQLLAEDGFWKIVDCEQEAHCIIEYVFDDKGKDKAYLRIKDREGAILYISPKVGATDWIPTHAGQESAIKLFEKYVKKLKKQIEG